MAAAQEPNHSINLHYKENIIRVTVDIPGLKTMRAGFSGRKPDERSVKLDVRFSDERVEVQAKILTGTSAGSEYYVALDKDDLNVYRIMPEPKNPYKVRDNLVELFIKKR
ncbi:uncharacterized protein LOC135497936 isoform X2 [Lineus longissimus]|uniref:uncharacterized protein LOC135497936 isoform X2 n=1 Tax=Lineus longissimus TaxID=88925 RepID=UPI00315D4021